MKIFTFLTVLSCMTTSCIYLLPEGRQVARLREQREAAMAESQRKQALLSEKQAEISALQCKVASVQKSIRRTSAAASPQQDRELSELKQLLQQKQQELQQLEQELYLAH